MRKIQRKLAAGEVPTDELVDGGLLLISGVFLLTPGLVTDIVGFVFVVPITRIPVRWAAKRWVVMPYIDAKTGGLATGQVYVGGFPDGDDVDGAPGPFAGGGPAGGAGGAGPRSGDHTVDLGEESYDIGMDEDDEDEG